MPRSVSEWTGVNFPELDTYHHHDRDQIVMVRTSTHILDLEVMPLVVYERKAYCPRPGHGWYADEVEVALNASAPSTYFSCPTCVERDMYSPGNTGTVKRIRG